MMSEIKLQTTFDSFTILILFEYFIDNFALPMFKIKYISNSSNNGQNKDKLIKSKNLILT